MKTKNKQEEKQFNTVETFREIKDKISKELFGKTPEEIKAYLKAKSLKLQSEK